MPGYGGWSGGWSGGWWLFWPIGWIVILAAAFGLWRWLSPRRGFYGPNRCGPVPYGPTDALAILEARLARGEIDPAEFDRLSQHLKR